MGILKRLFNKPYKFVSRRQAHNVADELARLTGENHYLWTQGLEVCVSRVKPLKCFVNEGTGVVEVTHEDSVKHTHMKKAMGLNFNV